MRGIFLLLFSALFTIASAKTYYVAPNGNDSNAGTIDSPWRSCQKAFDSVRPGDTVYFRGGVYMVPSDHKGGYTLTKSGTESDTIFFMNHPGEVPIIDFNNVTQGYIYNNNVHFGIRVSNVEYVKMKGLTVRNVWQQDGDDEAQAFTISHSSNIVIENCTAYNTHGHGFESLTCDETYFINCDSYNHCNELTTVPVSNPRPGDAGTGFFDLNWSETGYSVYYKNCRAWNCSDQGFSTGSYSYTEYDGCWSFRNGKIKGGGHGFKLGWNPDASIPLARQVNNCIAAYNRACGFTTNDLGYLAQSMHIFNNIAYHNGYYNDWSIPTYGFFIYNTISSDQKELTRIFKNNITYDNENGAVLVGAGAVYSHDHNSWDTYSGINITDNDFLSVDSTGLAGPRQKDGSLPDLDFLKLSPGSSLIDAGTNVGLPYTGDSPDLGAYEYREPESNMLPAVEIKTPTPNSKTTPPATVEVQVKTFDIDGEIIKVELYDGATRISDISSPPWSFTWDNIEAGTYLLTAVATDNKNEKATSLPVNVIVEDRVFNDLNDLITLYPNPNHGIFTIEFINPLQNYPGDIVISSLDGRSVFKGYMEEGESTKHFDLSYLSPGFYILTLSINEIIATKKFLKQ